MVRLICSFPTNGTNAETDSDVKPTKKFKTRWLLHPDYLSKNPIVEHTFLNVSFFLVLYVFSESSGAISSGAISNTCP